MILKKYKININTIVIISGKVKVDLVYKKSVKKKILLLKK